MEPPEGIVLLSLAHRVSEMAYSNVFIIYSAMHVFFYITNPLIMTINLEMVSYIEIIENVHQFDNAE